LNLRAETILFIIIATISLVAASFLITHRFDFPTPVAVNEPERITVYNVEEGDLIEDVAESLYGTPMYAPAIVWASTLRAERDNSPAYSINTENLQLRAGQKLSIPSVDEITQRQAEIDRAARINSFIEEQSISDLQQMMESGALTARELVEIYLTRIEALDGAGPVLNSIIEINPDVLEIADALDRERESSGPRGPLHGIPVLLKDNIDTADKMNTTAGSVTLLGSKPAQDAFVVEGLRQAGAIIFGKANLSEWANYRGSPSISGWSARGGFTRNPYRLDFTPWGSSAGSGVAVAANLVTVALGTETAGSITAPSVINGVVGFKPTVGLTSRAGVVPIAHSFDTVGPMTRTVRDAAIVLGAITGVDPRDPLTANSTGKFHNDYVQFLDEDGLNGARIGVPNSLINDLAPDVQQLFDNALAVMESQGAELIYFDDVPNQEALLSYEDVGVLEILSYEFHDDIANYLGTRVVDPENPADLIPRTINDLIELNQLSADRELQFFGQELFEHTAARGEIDEAAYQEGFNTYRRLSGEEGVKPFILENNLDALVLPTNESLARIYAALAGYPLFTVPGGFTDNGLPWGLGFFSYEYTEPTLARLAYAYEQATMHRQPPTYSLTLIER